MARQTIKQTTRTTYRKSQTKPKHCPVCGKFWNKGNSNAKTRVHK